MAISRAKKGTIVAGYEEAMASAQHAFVIGFKGITVEQVTELRRRIREKGGHYLVVKNSLARRAVDAIGGFPASQAKSALTEAVAFAVARAY